MLGIASIVWTMGFPLALCFGFIVILAAVIWTNVQDAIWEIKRRRRERKAQP